MSEHPKVALERAQEICERVYQLLAPAAERLEVAGSVARRAPQVGDLELVMISKLDLFWQPVINSHIHIMAAREHWKIIQDGPKAKRLDLGEIQLDLYITTPEQWGVIKALRTGPRELSKALVTKKRAGGFMPANMQIKDGKLWRIPPDGSPRFVIPTPEERDLFERLGVPYLPPHKRDVLLEKRQQSKSDG